MEETIKVRTRGGAESFGVLTGVETRRLKGPRHALKLIATVRLCGFPLELTGTAVSGRLRGGTERMYSVDREEVLKLSSRP